MGKKVYTATALTGGSSGALDAINGSLLVDGDLAIVTAASGVYIYELDHDNSSAESSPEIICPDKNYGTKRWVLQEPYLNNQINDVVFGPASSTNHNMAMFNGTDGKAIEDSGITLTQLTDLTDGGASTAHYHVLASKLISTTHDISATGSQAITGAGFQPSGGIIIGTIDDDETACWAIFDSTRTLGSIIAGRADVADDFEPWSNFALYPNGGVGAYAYFSIASLDSDGLTLTWGKSGSPTGTATIKLLLFK